MADFARLELPNGIVALFETKDSSFVAEHAGRAGDVRLQDAALKLHDAAAAASEMCKIIREHVSPDSLSLELGLGLSGEVGWFFAKSSVEGAVKLTLTWSGADEE